MKRNKLMKHIFNNKESGNTVIVANTSNSSIKTLIEDEDYKENLYRLLKQEYKKSLKNTNIYIIWDRDKIKAKDNDDKTNQNYFKKAINTFYSSLDNDYEMNGLLLLSYPCHESFILSNFSKKYGKNKYKSSADCKKDLRNSQFSFDKITAKSLLLAAENMHRSLLDYNVRRYDPTNLKQVNLTVFRKEEETYRKDHAFDALSLISVMLIDLGIIEENNK